VIKEIAFFSVEERPQFIKRPVKELKVAENTDVNLTCQTSGKPDPIVTWYRDGQQITGGRYQILPNGDLSITVIIVCCLCFVGTKNHKNYVNHKMHWIQHNVIKFISDLWFSSGTPVSSTNKTDHHYITEILLNVVLNTITLICVLCLV
jgi:hypothetical protein